MAGRQRLVRIFLIAERQQRGEIAQVLLEQVEHGRDPPLAEPDPRPHPLRLELFRPGVGSLLEQRDPGLRPQFPAEQERRVRAERDLHAGQRLGRVPVAAERLRADLQVELDAGAGSLRRDRVDVGVQPVHAVDRDVHLLAAGGEHLVIQQLVARVRGDRLLIDVGLPQRRQDADHGQPGAASPGPLVGVIEAGPDLILQLAERGAGQRARRDVDLQVELAKLGRPGRVGDRAEHVGVLHRRPAVVVHQVQLDLEPHLLRLRLEPGLAQHPGQHVEAVPDLLPVGTPVRLADHDRRDIPAHRSLPAASMAIAWHGRRPVARLTGGWPAGPGGGRPAAARGPARLPGAQWQCVVM